MNKDIRETSVERGWQSMQAMLDSELPGKKQKRPLLWWWLLAASVAGVVSFWNYSSPIVKPANNSVPQQQDMSVPMASSVPASKNNQRADTGKSPSENRTEPRLTLPMSNGLAVHVALSDTLNEPEAGLRGHQNAFSDSTLSLGSDSYAVNKIPVLTSLQPVTTDVVSIGEVNQTVQPVCTDICPGNAAMYKKGRAGIAIGAIASRSLTGVSAGFIYTRHAGRRFAVKGGLSMTLFSPSGSNQPVLMFSDQEYLGATSYAFSSSDQLGNLIQSQDVFTQAGQFVEVPLKSWIAAELTAMVQYKLNRKLWLQTGAVGSLTARSIISPLNYTGNIILHPDKRALNSLESLAGPVIRKFTTDLMTGISWYGGRHVEWSLNVRVPLNSNIKYRKLANSAMSASNAGFDKESVNLFTGSGASALLTASASWNF